MSILADPERIIMYLSKGIRKCAGGHGCKRQVQIPAKYCSYECACYGGEFSVRKGWLKNESKA